MVTSVNSKMKLVSSVEWLYSCIFRKIGKNIVINYLLVPWVREWVKQWIIKIRKSNLRVSCSNLIHGAFVNCMLDQARVSLIIIHILANWETDVFRAIAQVVQKKIHFKNQYIPNCLIWNRSLKNRHRFIEIFWH